MRAAKKLEYDEITIEQFDEKFYTFYKGRKIYSSSDTTIQLKFTGSYVSRDNIGRYRVYKFFPNGKVIGTWPMDTYPNNISILNINKEYDYYKLIGNQIKVEYLSIRDWNVYNIFKEGEIRGDSLIFYQVRNKQIPWLKSKDYKLYIYDSKLTAFF